MTGKFLTEELQTKLNISGEVAIWVSSTAESSELLKDKMRALSEWIRKVALN